MRREAPNVYRERCPRKICPAGNPAFAKVANEKHLITTKDSFIPQKVEVNFLKNLDIFLSKFRFSLCKYLSGLCAKKSARLRHGVCR